MKKILVSLCLILASIAPMTAQEPEDGQEKLEHHQLGALLAHTRMKEGDVTTEKNHISVPSLTLYYNYRFNPRWFLGLHTDIVNEQFIVESLGDEESIERKRPVAPAVMLGFKPGEHFSFLVGGGVDIDSEETLGLMRFDVEYGLEIRDGWEFVAALGYDLRFGAYGSTQFGVGIAKSL